LKGGTFWQASRETRREIAKSYLVVIARSEATKQSTLSLLLLHGLLRFEGETRWRGDGSLWAAPYASLPVVIIRHRI
jgi:hypothetical protein